MTDTITECMQCGREFTSPAHWESEHHDGYGTRRELCADASVCDGCKGEAECEGTFEIRDGKLIPIDCHQPARTRMIEENSGRMTWVGNRCDDCHDFYEEDQ